MQAKQAKKKENFFRSKCCCRIYEEDTIDCSPLASFGAMDGGRLIAPFYDQPLTEMPVETESCSPFIFPAVNNSYSIEGSETASGVAFYIQWFPKSGLESYGFRIIVGQAAFLKVCPPLYHSTWFTFWEAPPDITGDDVSTNYFHIRQPDIMGLMVLRGSGQMGRLLKHIPEHCLPSPLALLVALH